MVSRRVRFKFRVQKEREEFCTEDAESTEGTEIVEAEKSKVERRRRREASAAGLGRKVEGATCG